MNFAPSLAPAVQIKLKQFFQLGLQQGCPKPQLLNFSKAGIILQARQLAASAAARLCYQPDGPKAVGYGGARGGGKTHWLLSQMGADDCQRVPGLKCLLLRKVGKSNLENFEDLRQRLFARLPHEFNASRGLLVFANGSRIQLGHYQCEKDIDSYLGLEYDVIGIEEATQLTARKYEDISTCCRTSKTHWRPRIYSTPGTSVAGIFPPASISKTFAPRFTSSAMASESPTPSNGLPPWTTATLIARLFCWAAAMRKTTCMWWTSTPSATGFPSGTRKRSRRCSPGTASTPARSI